MNRLFFILLVVCAVSATRCVIKDDKQDEPEIHIIRLGDPSGESEDSEVVTLQIPDNRRKRHALKSCKESSECSRGQMCIPFFGCIKRQRNGRSSELHVAA